MAGIRRVVLPFVDNARIESPEQQTRVVQLLRRTMACAEESEVELHLETSLDPKAFASLLAGLPHPMLKANYDSGNSSSLGYNVRQELAAYGRRIGSVHIKDRIRGGGTVPLGTGNADIPALLAGLAAIAYLGDYVLQVARRRSPVGAAQSGVSCRAVGPRRRRDSGEHAMKVLIVGLGGIGQRHVRNLRVLLGNSAEFLAWRTRRLSRVITPTLQADPARDVEKEYGIQAFGTLEAALAEGPRIALVCNPTSLHVPVALACIRAGCDVFLEKPVFSSLEGVPELLAAAEASKRVVMVGYQLRFHPCFRRLQEILHAGTLGRLLAVRATVGEYLPGWHTYEDYRQMYASRARLGGGVILSQIHEFDYLYALFGKPLRLFSLGGHWSNLEIDVEDVASTLIEFQADGRPLPVHLQQDYLQRPASRSCEVLGDTGKAIMDLRTPSLIRFDNQGEIAASHIWEGFERNQLFLDEMKHFLECVETRSKPFVDLEDGVLSLQMALAAKESIASGRIVDLVEVNAHAGSVFA